MKNRNIALLGAIIITLCSYAPAQVYANDKDACEQEKGTTSNHGEAEEIPLGFDHYVYLPEDFNPYSGMLFPIDAIEVVEFEEEPILGFDHYSYLPEDFNPYYGIQLSLEAIVVVEVDEEVVLDYDHKAFLPPGFNAYEGMYFGIEDIEVIELPYDTDECHGEESLPATKPASLGR